MMKSVRIKLLMAPILFGAALFCGTGSARAEQLPPIVVDVPFEFTVNGKTLPAGRYRVTRPMADSASVLYIRKEGGTEGASFTTNAAIDKSAENKAGLIFHHYGATYYLAEVVTGSNNTGYRLPVSEGERIAARVDRNSNQKSGTEKTASQPEKAVVGPKSK